MKCCQWLFSLHIIYFAMENETIQFLSIFFSLSSMSFLFMLTPCRQSVPPRFLLGLDHCPSSQSALHWRVGTVLCKSFTMPSHCPATQFVGCCAHHWTVGTVSFYFLDLKIVQLHKVLGVVHATGELALFFTNSFLIKRLEHCPAAVSAGCCALCTPPDSWHSSL